MWHLLIRNLQGRRVTGAIIVLAVALAVAAVFSASLMAEAVHWQVRHKQRLLGPELAVVPAGTRERGQIYLSKGPPAHGLVEAGVTAALERFPEIERHSPQTLTGTATLGNETVWLVDYDPATDFMVRPWLEDGRNGMDGGVLLGSAVAWSPGQGTLTLDGTAHPVAGRLRETGSFMDRAVFFPRPGLAGQPSWILLAVRPGTSVDLLINTLQTHVPGIEVIARPELLKTINDQLHGVLRGGGLQAAAGLVAAGALLVVAAVFALMVAERRREFGLLKAMGAGNRQVLILILGEGIVLGAAGAVGGLGLSALWLGLGGGDVPSLMTDRTAWVAVRAGLALAVTAGVVALAALVPAVVAARMEPYAAIRSGE